MLVLTRKKDEVISIGPDIEIVVVEIKGNAVKIGIRAPADTIVDRAEVRIARESGKAKAA